MTDDILNKILKTKLYIIDEYDEEKIEEIVRNVDGKTLLVLDDVIADINKSRLTKKLFWNYRHIPLSVMVMSQKYTALNNALRNNINSLVMFKVVNNQELYFLYKDRIPIDEKKYYSMMDFVFDKKYNKLRINFEDNKYYKNDDEIEV